MYVAHLLWRSAARLEVDGTAVFDRYTLKSGVYGRPCGIDREMYVQLLCRKVSSSLISLIRQSLCRLHHVYGGAYTRTGYVHTYKKPGETRRSRAEYSDFRIVVDPPNLAVLKENQEVLPRRCWH